MGKVLSLVIVAAIIGAGYYFYLQKMPTSDRGTTAPQAVSLTGVRMDLNQIAQAERTYFASNGKCGSLEDLTNSGTMNLARISRDGYAYEVQCGEANQFSITARHAPAPSGSNFRYPTLSIDQNMQLGEVH
jgi:hypothetical protein